MLTKYYGFVTWLAVAGIVAWKALRVRQFDGKAVAVLLFCGLLFAWFYPVEKMSAGWVRYGGQTGLGFDAMALVLARLEPVLLLLMGYGLYMLIRHRPTSGHDDTAVPYLVGVLLLLFAGLYFSPVTQLRYGLAIWPMAILLSAWVLSQAPSLLKKAAWLLTALLFLQVVWTGPYFDSYANPVGQGLGLGSVERASVLGAHAYLLHQKGTIATDDPYALPYSFDYDAQYVGGAAFEQGTLRSSIGVQFYSLYCNDRPRLESYFKTAGFAFFASRTDGLQVPLHCPALSQWAQVRTPAYSDSHLKIYAVN